MSTTFKIGDTVQAKESTPYSVTTNGWVGIVNEVSPNRINVTGDDGRGPYEVLPQYFTLIGAKMKKDKTLHVGDSVRLSKTSQFYKPNRSQKANNGTVTTVQGNTLMVKMGTGSHKVMTIKDVVKNPVKGKAKVNNVPALKTYDNYDIKRFDSGARIAFGCGEVQVNRQDLLDAADLLEKPGVPTQVTRVRNMGMSDEQIIALAELVRDPAYKKGRAALDRLTYAAGSRRNFNQIANIPATTLRRIAG